MIIYNSVAEEIARKFQNQDDGIAFINDLISLYGPNDKNKDGENLLTIFLNNSDIKYNKEHLITYFQISKDKDCIDFKTLNNFFDKKFKLQIDKIKPYRWNGLTDYFISTNRLEQLPKLLSQKDDWFYFKIPTIHIQNLFDYFYKPKVVLYNEKDTILNYIFNNNIIFSKLEEIDIYLNDAEKIMTTLFVNKNLPQEQLEFLTKDKFISQLYSCIEKPLKDFNSLDNIKQAISQAFQQQSAVLKMQSSEFDSEAYLMTLKSEIYGKILNNDLSAKSTPTKKTKKI